MSDFSKDPTKMPGGRAGGAASAARPEQDRRESARKAAVTRRQNMVGPGESAKENQPQAYHTEQLGASLQVEREGDKEGLQQQFASADEDAEKVQNAQERADRDYDPGNPDEELMEKQAAGL